MTIKMVPQRKTFCTPAVHIIISRWNCSCYFNVHSNNACCSHGSLTKTWYFGHLVSTHSGFLSFHENLNSFHHWDFPDEFSKFQGNSYPMQGGCCTIWADWQWFWSFQICMNEKVHWLFSFHLLSSMSWLNILTKPWGLWNMANLVCQSMSELIVLCHLKSMCWQQDDRYQCHTA